MTDNHQENARPQNEIPHDPGNLPQFYSKRLILVFSGLFSVLFGAVLLISNLRCIKERKGIMQVLVFIIIYVIGIIFTMQSAKTSTNFSLPLNILGGLILNEYFWNRYIGKETEYEKKDWIKPALISLGISIPAFLALVYLG